MPKHASDATLLRNARADIRRLTAELLESRATATRALLKQRLLEKDVEEWKARFDALLKRDAAMSRQEDTK